MNINKLFIAGGVLAATMSLSSCVGDLDLVPTNPNDITVGTFAEDPEGYMRQVIADVYMNISTFGPNGNNILSSMDGGMSTFQRSIFNLEEIPSDEASWIPASDAIPHTFQYGEVTAAETVCRGAYNRMQLICSLCNQFIQTDFPLENDTQVALKEEFDRQARILRSGMYFYLISNFGNVPLNDENVLIGEIPPQLSTNFSEGRRLVTESVVNTLEEIVSWYKANDPNNNPPYGYVGLDVAEALLVKFYLNYEVFTGSTAWDKCLSHAQALIGRRGTGGFQNSGLANNYFQNFAFNNTNENEIIWRIVSQNADTHLDASGNPTGVQNWANGGLMMMGWIGGDILSKYNAPTGWKCIVARRQFVEVFDWNADYTSSADDRVTWWATAADGFAIDNPNLDYDDWGNNGYLAVKYLNWNIDDNGNVMADVPASIDPTCIDYGMIRLAEIYLSAAEAAFYLGDSETAKSYVNLIRQRAKLSGFDTITLAQIQDERQRELYTECTRRTDLVRYGKWISGYNWNWKYHAETGTDFPARFTVYPIPSVVVTDNGYTQNPGY